MNLEKKTPITLTSSALKQIEYLLEHRGKPSKGIRIGINTKGCSGLSYTLEYADSIKTDEEVITLYNSNTKILIEPKAMMFLIGTEMDYEVNTMDEGFIFRNPNEKGRCGCGESFHV